MGIKVESPVFNLNKGETLESNFEPPYLPGGMANTSRAVT